MSASSLKLLLIIINRNVMAQARRSINLTTVLQSESIQQLARDLAQLQNVHFQIPEQNNVILHFSPAQKRAFREGNK